jgi:succinate-semialdehyde dehydrogenase/glutarate-semialdehyde dehydrogenase
MVARMRNMGESCCAANRIFVHTSIADEFTSR